MKKILVTLLLMVAFPLMASHIVGGEFELIHISGNNYRLNLIIYFDQINGVEGAKDPSAEVSIYRKRDNQLITTVTLIKEISETNVPYTQPVCSNGEIVTTKLVYTTTLQLSDELFNDPQGYYISWQRCCRNYQITNIVSDQPPPNDPNFANAAGQTFYLEFPAVVKTGQPFINSTPRLFPPLNDFACPFRPYYVDFRGTDDDGDSLVYTLVTPLNTKTSTALPLTAPGPYPPIKWKTGFSLDRIMLGNPDLKISRTGILTVKPSMQGLFVFAVRVEEYRDNLKIGETRRDFQMLVVDACPAAEPPQIKGKRLADASFTFVDNMSVSFPNTTADADRCIQVRVSDPDSGKPEDSFIEKISIRVVPLNFKKDISSILPTVTNATLVNGSTVDFKLCFPKCPYFEGGPYQIGIIAMDDACSLPLLDTLKVTVNVQPPFNTNPYYVNPVDHITPISINQNIVKNEGGFYESNFEIRDAEANTLITAVVTDGFALADAGITVTFNEPRIDGVVTGKIRWDAFCNIYDFTKRTSFQVKIIANDVDACNFGDPVVATYVFTVVLPGNAAPTIDSDLTADPQERRVLNLQRHLYESISFLVTGQDQTDNDFLVLDILKRDSLALLGIDFTAANGNGITSSQFTWNIACDANINLKQKDLFYFKFLVVDNANKCRLYKADTLDVSIKVLPPLNTAPVLNISQNGNDVTDGTVAITLGETIYFALTGTDTDVLPQDLISLNLLDVDGPNPAGITFTPIKGYGGVATALSWNPDCSIFTEGVYENKYTFRFTLTDDRCIAIKADTALLTLILKDVDGSGRDFQPPNVFTPNGDRCNDYFALEGIEPCPFNPDPTFNANRQVALPPDNCGGRFESVRIYNRWGKQVFESNERTFRWGAPNQPAGVYYYIIQYTTHEYKGALSVKF